MNAPIVHRDPGDENDVMTEKTPAQLRAAVIAAHAKYASTEGVTVCNYDDEDSFVTYYPDAGGYSIEAFVFVPEAEVARHALCRGEGGV